MTTWLKSLIMRQNSQLLSTLSAPNCLEGEEEGGNWSRDLLDWPAGSCEKRNKSAALSQLRRVRNLSGIKETRAQTFKRQQVISVDGHQDRRENICAQESPASRLMSQNGQQVARTRTTSCHHHNHHSTSNICSDIKANEKMLASCQESERESSKMSPTCCKRTNEATRKENVNNANEKKKSYLSRKEEFATSQVVDCFSNKKNGHPNYNHNHFDHQTQPSWRTLRASQLVLVHLLLGLLLVWVAQVKAAASFSSSSSSSSSSVRQYFDGQPENVTLVGNGHDVRLRCLIRNRLGECAWTRNSEVIFPFKDKYSFARQPEDGDCSLRIQNATVELDDGVWQCQVAPSELNRKPLLSQKTSLIVLIPPERPQFKDLPSQSSQQGNPKLVVEENGNKSVTCAISGGNPAPVIEWQLDGKNISKEAQSSSFFASENSQLLRVTSSKLRLADIKRTMNGKNLTCFALHQTHNQSTSVELDVQYVPTVTVVQRDFTIVEGSPLSISCQVDANPAPSLIGWRLTKDGPPALSSVGSGAKKATRDEPQTTSVGPVLEFQHIGRDSNQDRYECFAQNTLGSSAPLEIKLNVLFAPAVLNSSHSESIQLANSTHLSCLFEGNPAPDIKWFYIDPLSKSASSAQLDNDKRSQLALRNVTYRNEGDYYCEARNFINGQAYSVRSSNILLDVYGEPQFLMKSPVQAKAVRGAKSDIALTFCSDPPPQRVYWQFGSIMLNVRWPLPCVS